MKQEATIVNVNGVLMAEITRSEACGECHACEFGRTQRMHYPLPAGNYREGDTVTLEISDRTASRAALMAYGIPLFCLAVGLILGSALFSAEWAQALTAIAFLAGGCVYLALSEKKRRQSGAYACQTHNTKEDS